MSAPATKDFSPRASKDQDANGGIVARILQGVAQFFYCFAIQRVQHLRTIEGDVGNGIFFSNRIFRRALFGSQSQNFIALGFADRNSRRSRVRLCGHSIRPRNHPLE